MSSVPHCRCDVPSRSAASPLRGFKELEIVVLGSHLGFACVLCPTTPSGGFSKQGWVDSAWEHVVFCLARFSLELRPPFLGPFPDVPMLMLNGEIDLQTPLESAERARKDWPNSVLLTIKDATRVTISNNECALGSH